MILCVLKHFWVNNKKLRVFNDAHSTRQVFAFSRVCNFISGAAAELQTWTGQTLPEFGKISFAEPLTICVNLQFTEKTRDNC